MNSDPLLPDQIDAELAARLARMTARNPRTSTGTSTAPSTRPSAPPSAIGQLASSPPPPPPPGTAPARRKRRHPARHSRSAALALSFVTTTGLAYAFAATDSNASATVAAPAGLVSSSQAVMAPTTTATSPSASAPVATPTSPIPAPTTVAPTTPAGPTVVNGASVHNRYGNVQVQATFAADGTLTNVDVLEAPSRDGESVQINNYAVPRLNSAALVAQSANVDTVSGATYTSIGYKESLQSAIDVARANSVTTIS